MKRFPIAFFVYCSIQCAVYIAHTTYGSPPWGPTGVFLFRLMDTALSGRWIVYARAAHAPANPRRVSLPVNKKQNKKSSPEIGVHVRTTHRISYACTWTVWTRCNYIHYTRYVCDVYHARAWSYYTEVALIVVIILYDVRGIYCTTGRSCVNRTEEKWDQTFWIIRRT